MTEDVELDYDYLAQRALRRVVRDALQVTADLGKAPGKHHFYIEFATGAEGVVIPADLASQFPDRMTIVLQHKFESLTVEEESFSVTLWFKGKAARLVIPFDAITSFADPGAEFGLKFDEAEAPRSEPPRGAPAPPDAAPPSPRDGAAGAEVVSLEKFRKK